LTTNKYKHYCARMSPGASPGGYGGGIGSCQYPQAKVSQEPKYDNAVRKRRRKKKKKDAS
jgi:hypothetical protein